MAKLARPTTAGTPRTPASSFSMDAISDQVFLLEPYAGRPDEQRTTNDQDNILGDHEDEPGFLLNLTPLSDDWLTDGFLGTITVSVDPSVTSTETGMGGGGQGGPGGPGGTPPDGGPGGPPPAQATETTTA